MRPALAPLVALLACARAPAPAAIGNTAAPVSGMAIDEIPALALARHEPGATDCRLSQVARRRFAGQRVHPCGTLDAYAGCTAGRPCSGPSPLRAQHVAAGRCARESLQRQVPFLVETLEEAPDGGGAASGMIGVIEGRELAVYTLHYDGGVTRIVRCTAPVPAPNGDAGDCLSTRCVQCVDRLLVAECRS